MPRDAAKNGGAAARDGAAAAAPPLDAAAAWGWPGVLQAACGSPAARRLLAEVSREGCAGAATACCEQLQASPLWAALATWRMQRVVAAGVVLWALLLPLFLLYQMSRVVLLPA